MNIEEAGWVYFLGIGGIGMSALARFLHAQGIPVSGYDKTASPLTQALELEGIPVSHLDRVEDLPRIMRKLPPHRVWVIRTPAVPATHPQLLHFQNSGFPILKRSELLGALTAGRPTLAVAGTHGKTTTSTWLAHILRGTAEGCNAFLGGIDAQSESNLMIRDGARWTVVEADEFDRSFHQLQPTHAVITSCEPDHLDIYGDAKSFRQAFSDFGRLVEKQILIHEAVDLAISGPSVFSYGVRHVGDSTSSLPDLAGLHARLDDEGWLTMDLHWQGALWMDNVRFAMAGWHNAENGLAAAGLAKWAGVTDREIREGLGSFQGIHRRFQYQIRSQKCVYIDDYAHHPSEIDAAIQAARLHHPNRQITVVFQPHLYSRTRDQVAGFAQSLAQADCLYLLPIYPAREEPIEGIHSQWLFEKISMTDKHLIQPEEIFRCLERCPSDVLLTLGAGNIDRLVQPLKQLIERHNNE